MKTFTVVTFGGVKDRLVTVYEDQHVLMEGFQYKDRFYHKVEGFLTGLAHANCLHREVNWYVGGELGRKVAGGQMAAPKTLKQIQRLR